MQTIAMVGVGQRGRRYLLAFAEEHRDDCRLVAVCDADPARLEAFREEWTGKGLTPRLFAAADYDRMLRETSPDRVLVLTPNFTHAEYACRAMELGCDVIIEKPLTTTYEDCRHLLETQARTGRDCTVAHNYRYNPAYRHIKHLLMSGTIGNIVQVSWVTGNDISFGMRMLHNWRGEKRYSGTLLVEKECHLLDLVNFWLGAVPRVVFARGSQNLCGPGAAKRLGLEGHAASCGECPRRDACPFPAQGAKPGAVAEGGTDAALRWNTCVFRPELDSCDTVTLAAEYDTGAQLSYVWSAARLGGGLLFTGTLGALEYTEDRPRRILLRRYNGPTETIEPWSAPGWHGGADPAMNLALFRDPPPEDPYGCRADLRDGVWAVLLGLSALESIETGLPVVPTDRVAVPRPDFRPMPTRDDPLPPAALRKPETVVQPSP